MADKIERDLKEVDEEIEKEENFEVDEEEKDFKDYDKETRPSVFSRMWNGVKNVFSSDDEDDEEKEANKSETEDNEDEESNSSDSDDEETDDESVARSKPAAVAPQEEKKINLNEIKDTDDMGRLIKISVGILERLPQNEFEKFKQSEDFTAYKDIVKKYKKR